MNREVFTNKIKEIRVLLNGDETDPAKASELLTEMFDNVGTVFDTAENLKNEVEEFKISNEKLRKTNMDLFLKIGDTSIKKEDETDKIDPEEPKKKSFEDLFTKEGGLK